jgi:hypothetical protein
MGLDTYASRSPDDIILTEEDIQAFADAYIELCGGIFSGDGNDGSFRGKVYASYVLEITDHSLYAEWLPPETVQEMYHAMAAYEQARIENDPDGQQLSNEHSDLCKFFKVCSDRGLGLIGWS